jgi:hypothetical protein
MITDKMIQSYFKGYFGQSFEPSDALEEIWHQAGKITVEYTKKVKK